MSTPATNEPQHATKRDFDAAAARWDEEPRRVKLSHDISIALLRELALRPEHALMDYGAGTGLVTLQLAPHVGRVLAVDGSEGMLDVLRSKVEAGGLKHVQTERADLDQGAVLHGTFDVIVSSMTLHHVREPVHLLRALTERLAVGGSLAIADLDAEGGRFHADPTGVFHEGFERGHIAELFQQAGLRGVRVVDAAGIDREHPTRGHEHFGVFLAIGHRAERR